MICMYLCERLVIRINIPKAYPTMHLRALKSRTQHQIMFAGGINNSPYPNNYLYRKMNV